MAKDTGKTHSAASAMRQSKKKRLMEISSVEIIEPNSSGIKCEKLCSRNVQSAMMVLVRSARSFFPKKESGIFRSFSARVILAHTAFRIGCEIGGVILKPGGQER